MSRHSQHLAIVKPKTAIEKRTKTTVDTIMVTPESLAKWQSPSGQRPIKENSKVRMISQLILEDGGVIPGIITIGIFGGLFWKIDGQHRIHAFLMTGLGEGYVDVRWVHAESMADINREFVDLNSKLVTMRPDDFLRGLEGTIGALQEIREACPFVGYDQIRRGTSSPIVSMSAILRLWRGSGMDTPNVPTGLSAVDLAETVVAEDVARLIEFLLVAREAFGADREYARLWTGINLVLCMWLYRKLVLTQYSSKSPRLDRAMFKKCLLSVSADSTYQDWLLGRKLGDRDRPPAYARLKTIFGKRLEAETGHKVQLPAPEWGGK